MAIIRRNDDALSSVDRLFGPTFMDRFFGPGFSRVSDRQGLALADWAPAVDVAECADAYEITAELPGTKREDVEVSLEGDTLKLTGERRQESTENNEDKHFHRVERSYGKFQRSFTLPEDVDREAIAARFDNGLLIVKLPRVAKEELPGRRTIDLG